MIAKAFIQQDPFEIWGTGEQSRNFTYVEDVVQALILSCEHIEDGSAVNAGTADFVSLNQAANTVFEIMDWKPGKIKYLEDKPVGVMHRAADISHAKATTGWEPAFSLEQGLKNTIDWYIKNNDRTQMTGNLNALLMSR